jgi:hypothetical protein
MALLLLIMMHTPGWILVLITVMILLSFLID